MGALPTPAAVKRTEGVAPRSWVASVAASRRVGVCDWSCAAVGRLGLVGAVGSVDLSLVVFMAHRVWVCAITDLTASDLTVSLAV